MKANEIKVSKEQVEKLAKYYDALNKVFERQMKEGRDESSNSTAFAISSLDYVFGIIGIEVGK